MKCNYQSAARKPLFSPYYRHKQHQTDVKMRTHQTIIKRHATSLKLGPLKAAFQAEK